MLVLTGAEVKQLCDMGRLIDEIERVFSLYVRGAAHMPPKVYLNLPEVGGDFRAMPACVDRTVGLKWVNCYPGNVALGLPTVMAVFILNDYATGCPVAILDGTVLTRLRTAAASAAATRHLARKDARTLGIIGCGAQAPPHIEALRLVRDFQELRLNDADEQRAVELASLYQGLARPASAEQAASSDVVVTLTPARAPVIEADWIRPGTHINAIGADGPGKQELDERLLSDSRVFVDDQGQAAHGGEINVAITAGNFREEDIAGTLGGLVSGTVVGRLSDDCTTIFDSTGLAIQDVATGLLVYREALRTNVGTIIQLGES